MTCRSSRRTVRSRGNRREDEYIHLTTLRLPANARIIEGPRRMIAPPFEHPGMVIETASTLEELMGLAHIEGVEAL